MPQSNDVPDFRQGDALSASKLQRVANAARNAVTGRGTFESSTFRATRPPKPPARAGNTTINTTGGGGHDGIIVLIKDDIAGAADADPAEFLTEDDIDHSVTAGEVVVFQDPPDDDLTANNLDQLPLWVCKGTKLSCPIFEAPTLIRTGTADDIDSSSITFEEGASIIDGYYDDDTVVVGSHTGTIGDYDGATRIATLVEDWGAGGTEFDYEIHSRSELRLKTITTTDDGGTEPKKVVRYVYQDVYWLDSKGFAVGEYKLADFPDYPEDEAFPPDGSGTYTELPDGFLKKRYRAECKFALGNYWIDFKSCKALPPPPLPTTE